MTTFAVYTVAAENTPPAGVGLQFIMAVHCGFVMVVTGAAPVTGAVTGATLLFVITVGGTAPVVGNTCEKAPTPGAPGALGTPPFIWKAGAPVKVNPAAGVMVTCAV